MYYGGMTSPAPLGDQLLSCVSRLNRWATRQASLSIPPAQARLLAQIEELGSTRIGDLARADHCSQPTMSAQLQRLGRQGWVRRAVDPLDARASLVELSEQGHRALRQVRTARAAVVAPLLERLDDSDRQRLREGLDVLQELLLAAAEPPPLPSPPIHLIPSSQEPARVAST